MVSNILHGNVAHCSSDVGGYEGDSETWLLVADSSKTSPPIHSVKFEWVAMDMLCIPPFSLNMYVRSKRFLMCNESSVLLFCFNVRWKMHGGGDS